MPPRSNPSRTPSCLPWSGEKQIGAALVVFEGRPARARHMRLEMWHAGRITQHPIHDGGCGQREPSERIAAADRNHRPGQPTEPLEEIIRMTGEGPKPVVENLAAVCRVFLEATQLPVCDRFAEDRDN